jgi:hypothetical protein
MAMIRGSASVVVSVGLLLLGFGCSTPGPAETSPAGSGGAPGGAGGRDSTASGGTTSQGGGSGVGGDTSTGGTGATGGGRASGGTTSTGGSPATGGAAGSAGGSRVTGGVTGSGGAAGGGGTAATGGSSSTGGAIGGGGAAATGGTRAAGGNGAGGATAMGGSTGAATGGAVSSGGANGNGGATGGGGCSITITSSATSPKMATVGVVEWSTTLANLTSAQIVWTLNNPGASILNKGGTAPVDLSKANYHTLLLGLKPSSTYTFHVEATAGGTTCKSDDKTLTTGTLSGAPTVSRTATTPSAQAKGFIIATPGVSTMGGSGGTQAYIINADGTVVWTAAAPASCSRARLDYEGNNLWMMALNVMNSGGEMRYVSLDGATTQNNVSGLSKAHHDFTVRKGGIITTMVWSTSGSDPESDLVERSASGTVSTVFHIGTNLYKGGASVLGGGANSFHCNSVLYHETDDSYTIGDRNPNLYVKATHAGSPVWQFGGNCSGAPAPKCVSGSWTSNHGHQLLDDGTFLFFSNGTFNSSSTPSYAYEYKLSTSGTMTANQVKAYKSANNSHSDSLGDVQRLPNGNTLVTFSNNGLIQELDSSWNVVQSLSAGSFGYSDWRETLYGPPPR